MRVMTSNPKTSVKSQAYPYKIPSIVYLKDEELKDPSSKDVLEFFGIEARLRSKKAMDDYQADLRSCGTKDKEAIWEEEWFYHKWNELLRSHHYLLLRSATENETVRDGHPYSPYGIHNLQITYLQDGGLAEEIMWAFEKSLSNENSPYLWLRIDSRYPHTTICKTLKEILKDKKQEYLDHTGKQETKPKKTLTLDPFTWIDYFQCYDLRHCEGKTFGKIAGIVYGDSTSKSYERAESACKRVSKLIRRIESQKWPPPPNFLNN